MPRVSPWLLPLLVAILVLGHVCELPAYVELVSHHGADGGAGEQLSSCEAVTATASSGNTQMGTGLDMAVVVPVIDAVPVSRAPRLFEDPAKLPDRLPLFLLHASLLI